MFEKRIGVVMSEFKTYGLDVKPIIESKARLLRFFKTKNFFAGRKFDVSFARALTLHSWEDRRNSKISEGNNLTNKYVVRDGKITHTNPFCPRCDEGVFMAEKGEWWPCGKRGDRYSKSRFSFRASDLLQDMHNEQV